MAGMYDTVLDHSGASAVMVRVHGPDPKGRKMRHHAFYFAESGDTTLSASGVLLLKQSRLSAVVVTCASIVEPFLSSRPHAVSTTMRQEFFQLIRGAGLEVLMEAPADPGEKRGKHCWVPAQLLALVNVPRASEALKALLDVQGASIEGVWEMGWTLAQVDGNAQLHGLGGEIGENRTTEESVWTERSKEIALDGLVKTTAGVAAAATRMAVLSLTVEPYMIPAGYKLMLSEACKRADFIKAVGSPFGALSPLHFFNSISVGIVSNCWPPSSSPISLLMADIRCLPGMEGGPVFDKSGNFVGILLRPLHQRGSGAEVQLVLTANVLTLALEEIGIKMTYNDQVGLIVEDGKVHQSPPNSTKLTGPNSSCKLQEPGISTNACLSQYVSTAVEQAVTAVVLVTVGDGAWASGIILNRTGLILTNAHLLEPWRFGKVKSSSAASSVANSSVLDRTLETMKFSGLDLVDEFKPKFKQHVRVRVDQQNSRSWHDAEVLFISQGPLDVALLQLKSVPSDFLRPIVLEARDPVPGSTAVVIGHGLFGPRSELCSSVSAGVVSRILKTGEITYEKGIPPLENENCNLNNPVMLQTTAAVHPGGSGGAVINSAGRMIGLVTSNARHSGGTIIPYLNFSIPCAALRPIFSFASGDTQKLSLLAELEKESELLSRVWALVPSAPPKTSPLLPLQIVPPNINAGDKSEPGPKKGSQFANFIADKQAELLLGQPQHHNVAKDGSTVSKPTFFVRSCL